MLSCVAFFASVLSIYRSNRAATSGQSTGASSTARSFEGRNEAPPSDRPSENVQPANTSLPGEMAVQLDDHSSKSYIRLPANPAVASKEALESEATFVAQRLVKAMPDEPMALHVLAMLEAQLHHTARAAELWTRCIELDPGTEPYYVNLAAIALDRGDSQLAVETLQRAQQNGLNSPNISHHLGVALNSLGRPEEAVEVVRETLESEPRSAAHWLILGQAELQLGKIAEAEKSLRKAVELGAETKAAYFSLFNVCMRLGKREEALGFREKYESFAEDSHLPVEDRYQVLSEAEARRICVSVLSEASALLLAIPDAKMAEHLLLRVLALDPENQAACLELADIYTKSKSVGNEIVVRERLLELDRLNLLNYLHLAKAYATGKMPGRAEATIKLGISLAPQTVIGYSAMTDFLLEQKQPAKAQWYVEQALALKPSRQGYELLARTLQAQGKQSEAQQALQAAAQTDGQPTNK